MPQHSGYYLMRSMEDSQKIALVVYRAGTRDGPSFDSHEEINEGNLYLSVHCSCIILSSSSRINKVDRDQISTVKR